VPNLASQHNKSSNLSDNEDLWAQNKSDRPWPLAKQVPKVTKMGNNVTIMGKRLESLEVTATYVS
jgi:hypothetical protein